MDPELTIQSRMARMKLKTNLSLLRNATNRKASRITYFKLINPVRSNHKVIYAIKVTVYFLTGLLFLSILSLFPKGLF